MSRLNQLVIGQGLAPLLLHVPSEYITDLPLPRRSFQRHVHSPALLLPQQRLSQGNVVLAELQPFPLREEHPFWEPEHPQQLRPSIRHQLPVKLLYV